MTYETASGAQKQASEALEAAKEVYAQLADERDRADHDLDTAREPDDHATARKTLWTDSLSRIAGKRMEASLKRIRAEADANNKKVVQELTANGKQAQKKSKR